MPRPLLIAGPCSAESRDQVLRTGSELAAGGISIFRAGVWKPRTQPGCFEGRGVEALPWLAELKARTGMLLATEVASAAHVRAALDAGIDILWIGARTTANPFAVQEIADTLAQLAPDTPVIVKNPVNPDLELWIGALERLSRAGVLRLAAAHRGFSVYDPGLYRNDPCWRIPIELHRRLPELPLLCDPSHIGGSRRLIAPIAQQAISLRFDGLLIESHCEPDKALSDAAQQLTPAGLTQLLAGLDWKSGAEESCEQLEQMRAQIDAIDSRLVALLAQRMDVSRRIGEFKRSRSIPVIQSERYARLMEERVAQATASGVDSAFMQRILAEIHAESVRLQS